jgi:vacuolar protein sorting-associated protein 45
MQRFVEQFPEYRKLKGNVSKHITLLNEAAAEIDRRDLMTLSEFEQELATLDDNSASFRVSTPLPRRLPTPPPTLPA